MSFVRTIPVYPNKWRFYMAPLMKNKPELLEFNWFLCARPYKDNKDNYVVDIGRYTLFFDEKTGKSYYVTFDATEDGSCLLMIASHQHNKERHSELQKLCGWDDPELSTECDLRTHPEKAYELSIREGYCGIAMRVKPAGGCACDLTCQSAEFLFDRKVVEESSRCPYIEYGRSHASHLRSQIPGFPSNEILKKARPGKDSLRLKTLLAPYFSS